MKEKKRKNYIQLLQLKCIGMRSHAHTPPTQAKTQNAQYCF